MRPRAFADLTQLSGPKFFRAVSEGLGHIARNVSAIDADSRRLALEKQGRGSRILNAFATEEAGKFLILLDAVRCPPLPEERFVAQFRKANEHLAKGLYAEANNIRPIDFAEVKHWVVRQSQEFFLDGPNGVDWIFRNHMTHSRENALYVDYVATQEGHYWDVPGDLDECVSSDSPAAVRMVLAISEAGMSGAMALQVIADIWRATPILDEMDVHELRRLNNFTLSELSRLGHLLERPSRDYSMIAADWFFPLYDLPLKEVKVKSSDLVAERENWSPE